jgi:hypothetical protein
MNQRSLERHLAAAVVALLGVGLSGCVRGANSRSAFPPGTEVDTVEVESERDTEPPATLTADRAEDVVIARRPTPALPQPLGSMTDAQLVDYLRSLRWKSRFSHYSTQKVNAPCVYHSTGNPCVVGDSADLLIQPEAGMSRWDYDAIPPNGLIVARIINHQSNKDADSLGFRGGAKTWWIVDDSAGTLRSRFFVRTYDPKAPIEFVTKTRPFIRCPHKDAPSGRAARGKFWNCAESKADSMLAVAPRDRGAPAASMATQFHLASFESRVPMPATPHPLAMLTSTWVTCAAGCCSTGP